jgi:thiol:disulfide interchange protein DsbC
MFQSRIFLKAMIVVTTLVIVYTLSIHAKELSMSTLGKLKASHKTLNTPNVTIKAGVDLGSVYFLKILYTSPKGNKEISYAYYDKGNKNLYIGRGYDFEGNPVTLPKDSKAIKEGVSFSYGTGSKEIYVITDPECPYCIRFEKAIHGKLKDYRVHVILYPLSFHKKAPMMVEWIMQAKSDEAKYKRLSDLMFNNSKEYEKLKSADFSYSPQVKEKIQKAKIAFAELEARGTPAVFDEKFKPIATSSFLQKPLKKFKPALNTDK